MLSKRLVAFGVVLGMGIGGFFDGIVLHQILQWHHLVCVTEHCRPISIEHLERQNRQDGYFHLATLVLTVVGSYGMFRHPPANPDARIFAGLVLCGWGIFNFVEGLIDHQILGIHHVVPGSAHEFAADMLFLASGPLLCGIGWVLMPRRTAP